MLEDGHNVRSLERDSGISDHGLDDENEQPYENDDYDDIDCQQFENKNSLSQDLRFLSGMPELCDVMFMVGEERQPMYGVKAILAIRSRVFYKLLYGPGASKSKQVNNTQTVTSSVGRRLLGKGETQKRNFSFIRHPNTSLRATSSVSNQPSNGSGQKLIVQIEEFDADVFKQLLEYVHTGSVVLRPKTLLGLLNAADHFALEELRRACAEYSQKCINLDTVCSLLVTAERYIQYKSSKIFVQRVLDFVDKNGDDVLQLADFVHLPRHVVELILSRDELNANEMNKFQCALRWSRHYILYHTQQSLVQTISPFMQYVAFHSMSAQQLMQNIRPLEVVPDRILMNALAFQADPNCVDSKVIMKRNNSANAHTSKLELDFTSAHNLKSELDFTKGQNLKQDTASRNYNMETTSKNRLIKSMKTNNLANHNRSRSVDRNLSKSSNSSNGSDSGFHEDYYGASIDHSEQIHSNDQKLDYACIPGTTVVHVESPVENERVVDGKKAKSYQDLSTFMNISSIHYRF